MKASGFFLNDTKRPYYILSPGFTRVSNGIRALHLLCHYLNKMGSEAYICTTETDLSLDTPYLTQEIIERHRKSGRVPIVIYPEVVHGNPFNAQSIVRYLLNHPGLLGGPKEFPDSDMVIAWQEDYMDLDRYKNPLYIWIPSIDTDIFNNKNNPKDKLRQKILVYPGRYINAEKDYPEIFENSTVITYEWPSSHEDLAALLREAKLIYVFANSAIVAEALLCGCPVVIKETIFTKKPDDRPGDTLSLMLPGVASGDSEEELQQARELIANYEDIYNGHKEDLWRQLRDFIEASQVLPHDGQNNIVMPLLKNNEESKNATYNNWLSKRKLRPADGQLHAERMVKTWRRQLKFMVLMPVTIDTFSLALRSVMAMTNQLYKEWKLIIVADFDEPGSGFGASEILGWLRIDDVRCSELLSQAYSAVINEIEFDWVAILPVGFDMEIQALLSLGDYIAKFPQVKALYTDSDTLLPDCSKNDPRFKTQFRPDYFYSTDYVGAAVWFSREAVGLKDESNGGKLTTHYEGILKVVENYSPRAIGHIPEVLIHLPEKNEDYEENLAALQRFFERQRLIADVTNCDKNNVRVIKYTCNALEKVTVVVIDELGKDCLDVCLNSIKSIIKYQNIEVVVVSESKNDDLECVWVTVSQDFNMIERYREGANRATGDYILFIDSRIQIVQSDFIDHILGIAGRNDVGIVAPRILNKNDKTVWQGPYLLGAGDFVEPMFISESSDILHHQISMQNPSAVSMACVLIKRSMYSDLHGFNPTFRSIESAGIDLCLRLESIGKYVVWTPFCSVLRRNFISYVGENNCITTRDQNDLLSNWKRCIGIDPSYSKHFSLKKGEHFKIDDIFHCSWDINFHEKTRILTICDGDIVETNFIKVLMEQLVEANFCQSTTIFNPSHCPDVGNILRMAPDVLVINVWRMGGLLEWLCKIRKLDIDVYIVLIIGGESSCQGDEYYIDREKINDIKDFVDKIVFSGVSNVLPSNADDHNVENMFTFLSDNIWSSLTCKKNVSGKLRVGWYGNVCDFADILSLRGVIKNTVSYIDWVFINEVPAELLEYAKEVRGINCTTLEFPQNLVDLKLDVSIVPVFITGIGLDNTHMRRVAEFSGLGIPVLASNVPELFIDNSPVNYIENCVDSWFVQLSTCANDKNSLFIKALEAQSWARERFLISHSIKKWAGVLQCCSEDKF